MKRIGTIESPNEYFPIFEDAEGRVLFGRFGSNGELSVEPSVSWQFLGACRVKPFGHIGGLIPVQDFESIGLNRPENWRFKNGKSKFLVCDLDHGTRRIWMSPGRDGFRGHS